MNSILAQCVLACSIFSFVNGDSLKVADSLEWADSEIQDTSIEGLEMPILRGHPYPFCDVRYQACKVVIKDECKCKKLAQCCKKCFRQGVFCRALSEVCLWVSLRCQCECLKDASNRNKKC